LAITFKPACLNPPAISLVTLDLPLMPLTAILTEIFLTLYETGPLQWTGKEVK